MSKKNAVKSGNNKIISLSLALLALIFGLYAVNSLTGVFNLNKSAKVVEPSPRITPKSTPKASPKATIAPKKYPTPRSGR